MFFSTPQRAALISVASNTLLVAGKAVVGVLSGSAALLSEALHSGLDLLAAV
ncbi:MAG: cation transporter, partial [Deltaproteobacteria bacterium]|nr:cation transporter [Deltaproteobacteria bacterium]